MENISNMPPTEQLFLQSTLLFTATARVLYSSKAVADSSKSEVVCDKTLFYSQGGGQPSDTGTISSNGLVCRPCF